MSTEYTVFSENKSYCVSENELLKLRNIRDRFDLWIDLDDRFAFEKTNGKIKIFRKKILGRLLCFLIMNIPRRYTAGELFETVWVADYDDIIDFRTVKTNISRLRSLLETSPPAWKYILKTEPTFLGRGGEYYFNNLSNYCLIFPLSGLQLFLK